MLEKNPELNQPEQELVADDAVKTFRKIIQKKHTEEKQETEDKTSVFLMRQQPVLYWLY